MNRCKDCKHYKMVNDIYNYSNQRVCNKIKCTSDSDIKEYRDKIVSLPASTYSMFDDSFLFVMPDFGCVLFKGKSDELK